MPTARPSMSASMGEMEDISMTLVRAMVPPTPTPTPIDGHEQRQAGGPEVPSMMSSTAAATAMPTTSEMPNSEDTSSTISLL